MNESHIFHIQHTTMESTPVHKIDRLSWAVSDMMMDLYQEQSSLTNKRQEIEKLDAEMEELQQVSCKLKQHIDELQKEFDLAMEEGSSYELFRMHEKALDLAKKAELESQAITQKEVDFQKLTKDYDKEVEKNHKLHIEVEKVKVDWDLLQGTVQISNFKDVHDLTNHVDIFVRLREEYHQRLSVATERANKLSAELKTVEAQHELKRLEMSTELAMLQKEESRLQNEVLSLDLECNRILEERTKQYAQLAQVEMAINNLYEMIKDKLGEQEAVMDKNDKHIMLDKIKRFILDYTELLRQYETDDVQPKKGKDTDTTPNTDQANSNSKVTLVALK